MLKTRITSSLEKALIGDPIESYPELKTISALKGERISFQLLHWGEELSGYKLIGEISLEGELAKYATLRDVRQVPVTMNTKAAGEISENNQYISAEPGIFPDLLTPMHYGTCSVTGNGKLGSVWIDIEIPRRIKAKKYTLTVTLRAVNVASTERSYTGETQTNTLTIDVIGAALPEDDIYLTQWFHADCLASYYGVKMWSKRHWEIVENFMRVAAKNKINLLLTPVFTPPLDTLIGGERPTTQLVGVTKTDSGYEFDFSLLDKWIKLAKKCGIKYFEVAHLFTQWGAGHAPKIMATVGGEYKKIFGWETDSASDEYIGFLRAFLTAFIAHMKELGEDKNCFYHISDEPSIDHLAHYKLVKSKIADLLEGYTIMDALSKYEFYSEGVVETPIPANNHIAPFIENHVPNLWTYYCCSQGNKVSNRLIAMPSWRNRSIGMQMYKFDIVGFLQWGFNFYYNCYSADIINPYIQQDGDEWVPAGDAYSVYPAIDGTALESIRLIVFTEALQDMKAMKLCEKYYSKKEIIRVIEETIGAELTFDRCAHSAEEILTIRETVNKMIKRALKGRK